VREIGYRVLRELQAESAAGSLLMEQASMCLATHLAGGYSENARPVERADRSHARLDARRLRRVLDYIEAHLEDDLSIGGLAAVACLSRHHFARAFKASLGEAPHVYIAARRLDHARNLLTGSSLTLAEVALACRFSSQATFTRAFQREIGLSPGLYRRRATTAVILPINLAAPLG
jgi:AraC family transcriptional regulator